jgi:RNA polymerase sigma factor (sigma-70 family)
MTAWQANGSAPFPGDLDTRATLLGRLRTTPDDPDVWSEFVDIYGRVILRWCHRWGVQSSDAEDVVQNVLLSLATRMRDFEYDPGRSFRAWLKTVALHELQHYVAKQRKAVQGSGADAFADRLETIEAREDLVRRLEDAFDQELLQQAAARVRLRVDPRSWEAFHCLAIQGLSGAEAARRLGMEVGTVFVARSRVQRLLRDEIARLEQA